MILHMFQLMPLPPRHLLLHQNPDWFNLSGAGLPRLSWKLLIGWPISSHCLNFPDLSTLHYLVHTSLNQMVRISESQKSPKPSTTLMDQPCQTASSPRRQRPHTFIDICLYTPALHNCPQTDRKWCWKCHPPNTCSVVSLLQTPKLSDSLAFSSYHEHWRQLSSTARQ